MNLKPTTSLCNDYSNDIYWDWEALGQETRRVFEICHGCRLCFNLCPSFNILFRLIDATHHEVEGVRETGVAEVMEACYHCKLCYNKCPYTPAEHHEYQLDFPRLVLRYKAQKAKRDGILLRDRLLSRPEILGKWGALAPALVNWANKFSWQRKLLQWVLGLHPQKWLPQIGPQTFHKWFQKRRVVGLTHQRKVVLFHTCFIEYNQPEIGQDAVYVLEKNGCEVIAPPHQVCCGMPALDCGDVALARERAMKNVSVLIPWVRQGIPIVAINPTCSLMLKEEFPGLLKGTPWEEPGRAIARATRDLGEYLFDLKQHQQWNESLGALLRGQKISYQAPCHLRAQNIGFRFRDLMTLIPGSHIQSVMECSGHDGTWAMKQEYFDLSKQAGRKCFQKIHDQQPDVVSTDCPLAALQIQQHTGYPVRHPIQLIADSYRSGETTRV